MNQYESRRSQSPLSHIDTSFAHYVSRRQAAENEHMDNGVPDYAFALDCELRKKLMQIPGFYSISKKIMATYAAREIQMINQQGLAVGPDQFPEIYKMGVDCAHRLGIGVPNIFIMNQPIMNAYTVAADDLSPVIVLYSAIVERLTPGELKCVIAHECGHIHNNHAVLKCVVNQLLNMGGNGLVAFALSAANIALMNFWTRAGEITADRAALICADNVQDALNVDYKLLYGALLKNDSAMNLDALRKQLQNIFDNPTRIMEFGDIAAMNFKDHPGELRRIFAELEFTECETYYKWRPEEKKPGAVQRTKAETDERCKKLVNILDNQ